MFNNLGYIRSSGFSFGWQFQFVLTDFWAKLRFQSERKIQAAVDRGSFQGNYELIGLQTKILSN